MEEAKSWWDTKLNDIKLFFETYKDKIFSSDETEITHHFSVRIGDHNQNLKTQF